MPAFNGKDCLLKIGSGTSPETFNTVSALKSLQVQIQRNTVDITNKDSGGFRELLNTAAIANGSISGSGVWTDTATQALMKALLLNGNYRNFQILYGSNDTFSFKGVVTSFQFTGGFDDAQMYSFTMESSGIITDTVTP